MFHQTTGITSFGFDAYFIISSQPVGSFWVVIYEGFYPYPRVITLPFQGYPTLQYPLAKSKTLPSPYPLKGKSKGIPSSYPP